MLLTVHDANLKKVAYIDNDKQSTLNYYDDTWTRNLETGSSTFEFTVFKKAIQSDTTSQKTYNLLNEKAFISFRYNGKSYVFSVMTVEEDEHTIKCYCENLNLELINEYTNGYKAEKAMTFVEYCNAMNLLNFTFLSVGINEISDRKRTLEWDTQETKLARLLSLVSEFDAEIDFDTQLNADSTIKSFKINVYKAYDETHQGVGRVREDVQLTYGKNLTSIKRKVDKTGIFNMVVPVGRRDEYSTTKTTTTTNPDGTTTTTERISKTDGSYTTTTTKYGTDGKVLSVKKVVATKNSDGTLSKQTSDAVSGSTTTSTTSENTVQNSDGSKTKTITKKYSDGRIEKTIVHTTTTEYSNGSSLTTTRTTKPDGSITELYTRKSATGVITKDTKVIKSATSGNKTVVSKSDSSSDEEFDLSGLADWKKTNDDKVLEFYKKGSAIYAPLSAQQYPAAFTSDTMEDQWIRKDAEFEAESEEELNALALAYLAKNAYPAITYEVSGFIDVEIGDTIKIHDDGFNPTLLLKARVSEQVISFTDPTNNKTTFSNFKALENRLSDGIQAAFNRLFEDSKPYLIKLATDNGVIFKNQIGQSIVTPTLYKGGKPVVNGVTWRWSLDGEVTTGMTYLVKGSSVTDVVTLTVAAYIDNDEVAVDEISLVNVLDGKIGTPGTPGKDGRTPYVHTAWANSADGRVGFDLESDINKTYRGEYQDYIIEDSTDPTKYKWVKVKGEQGDPGADGNGIASVVNYYLATTASSGVTRSTAGWTTTVQMISASKRYLWSYRTETYTDGTSKTTDPVIIGTHGATGENGNKVYTSKYELRANQSNVYLSDLTPSAIPPNLPPIGSIVIAPSGKMYTIASIQQDSTPPSYTSGELVGDIKGPDGKTPYIHFAYSDNADGTSLVLTDSGQRYIGHYSDYTQADSTDKTKYRWADRWAKIDVGGVNQISLTGALNGYRLGVVGDNYADSLHTVTKFIPVKYSNYVLSYDGELDSDYRHFYSLAWYSAPEVSGFISRPTGSARQTDLINGIKLTPPANATYLRVSFPTNFDKVMLNGGTVKLNWSQSPEDIQADINSKADQALTQAQINAINEDRVRREQELKAEMLEKAVEEWVSKYQELMNADLEKVKQSENELVEAAKKAVQIEWSLDGMKQRWSDQKDYIDVTGGAIILGKEGNNAQVKITKDRISMSSGGKDVMWIEQNLLHIENGVFTKTIQIGKFIFQEYENDADALVIRYAGG